MSFQAYLDNAERKTGKTPQDFINLAAAKGFDQPTVKSKEVHDWLKSDFELGHGHAMALVHVIKNGASISDKHVGKSGPHGDASATLRLDGLAARDQ